MQDIIDTLKGVGQRLAFEGKYHVLTGILLTLASRGETATYGQVADMMRVFLGPTSQFFAGSQDLARLLGRRQSEDAAKAGPLLSSLVTAQSGMPGDGYFTQAASLGLLDPKATDTQKRAFWEAQRDACFKLF